MPGDAPKHYDVVILGGGITGLVAAWKLAEAGHRVAIVEKEGEPGGVIKTESDGGWLLDLGANSIGFREGDDVHELINSLGLADELLIRPVRESDRYIWRRGSLRRVPVSPLHLLRKNALSRRMVIRAAWRMFQPHTRPVQDISIGAYFSTCLGRKVVDHVLAPAMAGIYAADPFCLSMQSVMPRLYEASQGHVSLSGALRRMKKLRAALPAPGGRRVLASFRSGMAELPAAVVKRVEELGADCHTSFDVTAVQQGADGLWLVTAADGRTVAAQRVVCSLPASAAADVLQNAVPDAAQSLRRIRYAPMMMAHVGVQEKDVGVAMPGFGYLAVRDNGVRSLGMIWNDRMFPGRAPEGHRLFTVFLGGQIDPGILNYPDDAVQEIIMNDLRLSMKWTGRELAMQRLTRMPAAIPLLEVGHSERVRSIQMMLPAGLVIAGNYVSGVSVSDCMRAGAAIAAGMEQAEQK